MRFLSLFGAVAALACATRVAAKRPLEPERLEQIRHAVDGRPIWLEPQFLTLHQPSFTPDAVSGLTTDGPRTIPLSELQAVTWSNRGPGRTSGRGFWAGMVLSPLLFGTLLAASPTKPDCGSCRIVGFIGGATLGLVVGPLFGRLISDATNVENRIDFR